MNGFSDVSEEAFWVDPRCIGAITFRYQGKAPAPITQLEAACKDDLSLQDVPKVSALRGMRLLGCFGSKPSADIVVRRR